jgi:hypothetical protein
VKTVEAPADANVIAAIRGDDASFFNVNRITSYEWVLEPVDPGDLPPGFKGHPKQRVLEVAGQTDGKTPLSVSKGQIVEVEVAAVSPIDSQKFNLNAQLLIQGSTWGDPAVVPLSILYGHVEIIPDSLRIPIASAGSGSVVFSVTLTNGPTTQVIFEVAKFIGDADVFVSEFPPPPHTVGPQLNQPLNPKPKLTITVSSVGNGFFHLAATAYDRRQSQLFVFQIN